jgi:hypothetical protein
MTALRVRFVFFPFFLAAAATAAGAGCSSGAPEDGDGAEPVDPADDVGESDDFASAGQAQSDRDGPPLWLGYSTDNRWKVNISYPHQHEMPARWARFAGKNMWHINLRLHHCGPQWSEQTCAARNGRTFAERRNYHIVWCRRGAGTQCQPPDPNKVICLYAWDKHDGEVLSSCFDDWDEFNREAWRAIEGRLNSLSPDWSWVAAGFSAVMAAISWLQQTAQGLAPISVNLPPDDATGKVGVSTLVQPLDNDRPVGIRPVDKIVELAGPNADLGAIEAGGRSVKIKANAKGDYRLRYCVKRADPLPGWEAGWQGAPPYTPKRRCGAVRYKATGQPPAVPPNCTDPERYLQCVASGWPPGCCATFHCN